MFLVAVEGGLVLSVLGITQEGFKCNCLTGQRII